MFCLKWFTSSHLEDSHLEDPPPSDTVTIMNMPDLVLREILKNVDLISMLNLRKVNRAFEYFIDDTKHLEFYLDEIHIRTSRSFIKLELDETNSQNSNEKKSKILNFSRIIFSGSTKECLMETDDYPTSFISKSQRVYGPNFMDQFEICLDGILKNQKKPLKVLNFQTFPDKKSTSGSSFGCCTFFRSSGKGFDSSKMVTDSVLDSLNRIMNSMKLGKISIESLGIDDFQLDQVTRLISIVKPEVLEDLVVDQISKNEELKGKVKTCSMCLESGNNRKPVFQNMHKLVIHMLTAQDLWNIKNMLLPFPNCVVLNIQCSQSSSAEEFCEALGDPVKEFTYDGVWFFDDSENRLQLLAGIYTYAKFKWIQKEEGSEKNPKSC